MSISYDDAGTDYDSGIGYDGASLFSPPTVTETFAGPYITYGTFDSLLGRLSRQVGVTVWKDSSGWHSQTSPTSNTLNAALVVPYDSLPGGENGQHIYLGGHVYAVSPEVAAELTAAGYVVG